MKDAKVCEYVPQQPEDHQRLLHWSEPSPRSEAGELLLLSPSMSVLSSPEQPCGLEAFSVTCNTDYPPDRRSPPPPMTTTSVLQQKEPSCRRNRTARGLKVPLQKTHLQCISLDPNSVCGVTRFWSLSCL